MKREALVTGPVDAADIPFDTTTRPEPPAEPHSFSLTEDIPGTELFPARDDSLELDGPWIREAFRGTARRVLCAKEPGGTIRLCFSGTAASLVRSMDFPVPGPYRPPVTGRLESRLDSGQWRAVSSDAGREVLLAGGLGPGNHQLEIRSAGQAPGRWALEGLRVWHENPAVVTGHIDGGPMLVDVRAEISGPVSFSRSLRDGRTGQFSLLLPAGGRYRAELSAPGWRSLSIPLDVRAGQHVQVPPIAMPALPSVDVVPRSPSADEPLVLLACAHGNTWGTEPAEWLARRVGWINSQRAHALLVANEVNPQYVAGALSGINCPLAITDGNHRHQEFPRWEPEAHRDIRIGPARILTAGMDTSDESWSGVLGRFEPQDQLRIICAYEPFAPPELLELAGVRLYFYGHNLEFPPYWTRGDTVFLRKIDANTFYRIEFAPPHDATSSVKITRFVFDRTI
jgi:hypothetical protein